MHEGILGGVGGEWLSVACAGRVSRFLLGTMEGWRVDIPFLGAASVFALAGRGRFDCWWLEVGLMVWGVFQGAILWGLRILKAHERSLMESRVIPKVDDMAL